MTDKHTILRSLGLLLLGTFACATRQPSPMLVEARADYDDARTGTPGELVPELVHEAKTSLDRAERANLRDPGEAEEQHLAYLAHRRVLIAVAVADQRRATSDAAKAAKSHETVLVAQRDDAQSSAARAGTQLGVERDKRKAAEEQARKALASLAAFGTVDAKAERTVITLSGEVLFTTGEATLLPAAQTRLDLVADALLGQSDGTQMVVEGHTDARGKDAYNLGLSQRRADAVRTYLVGRGVPADMIKAVGKGELEPIADNKSAEGRANNRRVEIEIDNASAAAAAK